MRNWCSAWCEIRTDIIDDLKSEYQDQFGIDKPGESIDGGAGNKGKEGVLTRAQIEKMTPAEVAANMPAVDAFLATQK